MTQNGDIDPEVVAELAGLRQSIDNIDAALVHLLAERFKATQQVGQLKAEKGLPPSDPDRERRQVARLRALAVASSSFCCCAMRRSQREEQPVTFGSAGALVTAVAMTAARAPKV